MQLPCSVGLASLLAFIASTGCASHQPPNLMLVPGRCDSVPAPLAPDEHRGGASPRAAGARPTRGSCSGSLPRRSRVEQSRAPV